MNLLWEKLFKVTDKFIKIEDCIRIWKLLYIRKNSCQNVRNILSRKREKIYGSTFIYPIKKKKEKRKKKKEKRKQGATMVSIVYLHLRESCRGNWHRSVAVEQVAGIVAVY
jgi:cation transport regulator ChaB